MKFKILFLLLFLSVHCFAQSENIKIEISIKENNWWKISAQNTLKVSVTNLSDDPLDKKAKTLRLLFSKCPIIKICNVRGNNFTSSVSLETQTQPKNEAYEFDINLKDLHWSDPVSSSYDFTQPKNFEIVPFSNNRLYAELIIFTGESPTSDTSKSRSYQTYKSNEIIFERKMKTSE